MIKEIIKMKTELKIKVNLIEGNAKRKYLKIMNFEQLTSYLGLHYNKLLIKRILNAYIGMLDLKSGDIINLQKMEFILLDSLEKNKVYINHRQIRIIPEVIVTSKTEIQINIRIYVKANDNGCELLVLV
jgi:hypothetical protein